MNRTSNIVTYLRKIKAQGLEINTVYDVGACIGNWMRMMHQSVLADAEFYLFEGNPVYKDILAATGSFSHIGVLSNPERTSVQFYNGNDTGDSYYKETTDHYDNRTAIDLPCRTLDSVIEEYNLPIPQFLKMDTQGSELDILAGASKIIGVTDLIYLECPVIEFNKGAPNIYEYISYMQKHGYIPTDVLELHKAEDVLLQIDIMFILAETKDRLFGKNVHIKPFSGVSK